jgi:hypothetical protein
VLVAGLLLAAGFVTTLAVCWIAAAFVDLWPGSVYTAYVARGAPQGLAAGSTGQVAEVSITETRRTLGTSWGVSYTTTPGVPGQSSPPLVLPLWADPMLRPWATVHDGRELLTSEEWPRDVTFPRTPYAVFAVDLRAYGWPMHALYRVDRYTGWSAGAGTWARDSAVMLPGTTAPDRIATPGPIVLPIGVRLLGLVANTIFFGAAWWAVLAGSRSISRHRRARRLARRGLCLRCGYDLRGTPAGAVCPECGRPRVG